jgi:hypothetical protein
MKRIHSLLALAVLGGAALAGGGCASIMHGGNRPLTVNTEPVGAKATITKDSGEAVSVQTTPFTVTLDPKKKYFKGQSYHLKLELPGYRTTELDVRAELSGWYFGNIVFGGLIGMLIVDPLTGAMWNLAPDKLDLKLDATTATIRPGGRGFVVRLLAETTPAERARMVRVN